MTCHIRPAHSLAVQRIDDRGCSVLVATAGPVPGPDRLRPLLSGPLLDRLMALPGPVVAIGVDRQAQRAWAYRDRLGMVPLFYARTNVGFVATTCPCETALSAGLPLDPDPAFVAVQLSLRPTLSRQSPVQQVLTLLPGELIVADRDRIQRHWSGAAAWPRRIRHHPAEPVPVRWREAVSAAVARQLPPDPATPVGVMLSGGLDSTAILAALASEHPHRPRTAVAWSVPDFPDADEGPQIRAVARHLDTPLTLVDGSGVWPGQGLEARISSGWPLLNPFQPMIDRVYATAAEQNVHWLLNGHGGDSLFAVHRYVLKDALRAGRTRSFARHLRQHLRHAGPPWRDPAIREVGRALVGWRSRTSAPPWLTQDAAAALVDVTDIGQGHPHPDQLRLCLAENPVPGAWLEQQAAASWSIVRRAPLQDTELIDLALTLPADRLLDTQGRKRLAVEAFGAELPPEVTHGNRTGLLTELFHDGLFVRERQALCDALATRDSLWPRIVRREFVDAVLANPRQHRSSSWLVVWMCWCLTLWEQKLRTVR